jgi:hypothetical protein
MDRSHLIFCRSTDAPGTMSALLKTALNDLGSSSGGGSDTFAQGVGPGVDANVVRQAVEHAKRELLEEIERMR